LYKGPARTGAEIKRDSEREFRKRMEANDWESDQEKEFSAKLHESTMELSDNTVFQDKYSFTTARLNNNWFVAQLRGIFSEAYSFFGLFDYHPKVNDLWLVKIGGNSSKLYRTDRCKNEDLLTKHKIKIESEEIMPPVSPKQVKRFLIDCTRLFDNTQPNLVLFDKYAPKEKSTDINMTCLHKYTEKKVGSMTQLGPAIMAEILLDSSSHTHYENTYEELIAINLKREEVNIYDIDSRGSLSLKEKGCNVSWSERNVAFSLDCKNKEKIDFNVSRAELTGSSYRQRRARFSEGVDMVYTYSGNLECKMGLPQVMENKF
jgi:hypothetical protein